ncbi:MAG: helix-turn-helix transcriptional regulator [Clostridia bacterium]|nr:helix-turn-helix transcriptional regulator [Clostridia bacterium]
MELHKKLKELRQRKGVTQEALAQHLDISAQAVSKWERDEGYPDITLLPRIAMYFDTSIDELLGLGEEKVKAEIEEWKNKSKELLFKGDVEANYDLWSEAYKKYPNDLDVIENYMRAMWDIFMKGDAKDKTLSEKVIELGKEILDRSTKTRQRDFALELMTYTYSHIGDYESAKKCAEMGGSIYSSVFHLMENALTGDEKIIYIQSMIASLTDDLSREVKSLAWLGKNYSAEEKIEILKYALNLYLALYDKETSGFHYTRTSELSSEIAYFYACCKDRENALKHLADAAKYAKIFDDYMVGVENGNVYKYKSLMLNKRDDKGMSFSKNYTENDCSTRLHSLNNKCYDFLRDDPEFQRIKEELEKNAKK